MFSDVASHFARATALAGLGGSSLDSSGLGGAVEAGHGSFPLLSLCVVRFGGSIRAGRHVWKRAVEEGEGSFEEEKQRRAGMGSISKYIKRHAGDQTFSSVEADLRWNICESMTG